jgi:hypothetical protein
MRMYRGMRMYRSRILLVVQVTIGEVGRGRIVDETGEGAFGKQKI